MNSLVYLDESKNDCPIVVVRVDQISRIEVSDEPKYDGVDAYLIVKFYGLDGEVFLESTLSDIDDVVSHTVRKDGESKVEFDESLTVFDSREYQQLLAWYTEERRIQVNSFSDELSFDELR